MLAFPERWLPELAGFLASHGLQVEGALAGVGDQALCHAGGARVRLQVCNVVRFPSDPLPIPVEWIGVLVSTEHFRPCNLRASDRALASVVASYLEAFRESLSSSPVPTQKSSY